MLKDFKTLSVSITIEVKVIGRNREETAKNIS